MQDGEATPERSLAYSLKDIGQAISNAFPDTLGPRPVTVLGEGWDAVAVLTSAGVVFRFPKRASVKKAHDVEARVLSHLAPVAPVAVPLVKWAAPPSPLCPWGFSGYEYIEGQKANFRELRTDHFHALVSQLASFLAAVDRFPIEQAVALGVPGPDEWRAAHERCGNLVDSVLRDHLSKNEAGLLKRWWEEFLDDERNWTFRPTLLHNDLEQEHILVDESGARLTGIIDFTDMRVGDPAANFSVFVQELGEETAQAMVSSYLAASGIDDPHLLGRARNLSYVSPFQVIKAAISLSGPQIPTLEEAVAYLRTSKLLAKA